MRELTKIELDALQQRFHSGVDKIVKERLADPDFRSLIEDYDWSNKRKLQCVKQFLLLGMVAGCKIFNEMRDEIHQNELYQQESSVTTIKENK